MNSKELALVAQLQADITLFNTLRTEIAAFAANPLGNLLTLVTLLGQLPTAVSDIEKTIADAKASV